MTPRSVSRRFTHDPSEIPRARQMVRAQLAAWGLDDEMAPLELAVSELVTNAVVHGQGLIDVRMEIVVDRIRLEVTDQGRATPAIRPGNGGGQASSIGGWGLQLVESLSDDWGVGREGESTRVWMERRADVGLPHRGLG